MRADRLLKLADLLETVPRKAFDLGLWETKRATKPEGKKQGECGFAGCAIGWATHAKLFRGLSFRRYTWCETPHLAYRDSTNWEAVQKLFSIGATQAYHLFEEDSYEGAATPKQVAFRIRKFIKDNAMSV